MAEECLLDELRLHATRQHEVEDLERRCARFREAETDRAVRSVFVAHPQHEFPERRIRDDSQQFLARIFAPGKIELIGALHQLRDALAVMLGVTVDLQHDAASCEKAEVIVAEALLFFFTRDLLLIHRAAIRDSSVTLP